MDATLGPIVSAPDDSELTQAAPPHFDAAARKAARPVTPLQRQSRTAASRILVAVQRTARRSSLLPIIVVLLLGAAFALAAATVFYSFSQPNPPAAAQPSRSEASQAGKDEVMPVAQGREKDSGEPAALPFSFSRTPAGDALVTIRQMVANYGHWRKGHHHRHGDGRGHRHKDD